MWTDDERELAEALHAASLKTTRRPSEKWPVWAELSSMYRKRYLEAARVILADVPDVLRRRVLAEQASAERAS